MPEPQVNQQPELSAVQQEQMQQSYLQAAIADSGQWFYYIAGLSVVNMILIQIKSPFILAVGLGVSELAMAMFPGMLGLIIGFIASAFFGVMGIFATQGAKWAFILGMLLYAADGVLTLMGGQIIGVAIHGYALFCLFNGLRLCFGQK